MEETPAVSSQSHVATLNFSVYWVFANAVRSFKGMFNTHDSPSPAWSGDPFGIHDEASIWIGYPISNLTARSFQWAWSYEFFLFPESAHWSKNKGDPQVKIRTYIRNWKGLTCITILRVGITEEHIKIYMQIQFRYTEMYKHMNFGPFAVFWTYGKWVGLPSRPSAML